MRVLVALCTAAALLLCNVAAAAQETNVSVPAGNSPVVVFAQDASGTVTRIRTLEPAEPHKVKIPKGSKPICTAAYGVELPGWAVGRDQDSRSMFGLRSKMDKPGRNYTIRVGEPTTSMIEAIIKLQKPAGNLCAGNGLVDQMLKRTFNQTALLTAAMLQLTAYNTWVVAHAGKPGSTCKDVVDCLGELERMISAEMQKQTLPAVHISIDVVAN